MNNQRIRKKQTMEKVKLILNEDFDASEYGRVISALVIGIGTALKEKTVTIDEAEQSLFNPYIMDILQLVGVSQEVIDLIHIGTEFEDIVSLVPERFDGALEEMIASAHQQVKSLPKTMDPSDKWFTIKPKQV